MPEDGNWLIDHTGIGTADIKRSIAFYEAALEPLGAKLLVRIGRDKAPVDDKNADVAGVAFGVDYPVFWIDVFHPGGARQHTAFCAPDREAVDAFHEHGWAAGGRDNGKPGLRAGGYPPGYYAAFLFDPDGNNIEAVCRENASG